MIKVIPVASGKGGVGKSIIALNLALSLTNQGKTVVLADFDLGGATQHLLLGMGIKGEEQGLGYLLHGREHRLENLVVPTSYQRLHFISGDVMLPGTHNLSMGFKQRIINEMHNLVADCIILDLGAGSSYTVVDFFLSSYGGIIVVNPEITSIMAAYGFIKTTLFRALYRLYPVGTEERNMIFKFIKERIEGAELTFNHLIDKLIVYNRAEGERVAHEIEKMKLKLVVNMSRNWQYDHEWGGKLVNIVKRKLGISLEILGITPFSERVRESVAQRTPIVYASKNDSFSVEIGKMTARITDYRLASVWESGMKLYDDDEKIVLKPSVYI